MILFDLTLCHWKTVMSYDKDSFKVVEILLLTTLFTRYFNVACLLLLDNLQWIYIMVYSAVAENVIVLAVDKLGTTWRHFKEKKRVFTTAYITEYPTLLKKGQLQMRRICLIICSIPRPDTHSHMLSTSKHYTTVNSLDNAIYLKPQAYLIQKIKMKEKHGYQSKGFEMVSNITWFYGKFWPGK